MRAKRKIYVVELFGKEKFYHFEEIYKFTPDQILKAIEDGMWGDLGGYFNEQIAYYERVYGNKPDVKITHYKDFDFDSFYSKYGKGVTRFTHKDGKLLKWYNNYFNIKGKIN